MWVRIRLAKSSLSKVFENPSAVLTTSDLYARKKSIACQLGNGFALNSVAADEGNDVATRGRRRIASRLTQWFSCAEIHAACKIGGFSAKRPRAHQEPVQLRALS